jgi:hypothetical protein
MKVDPFVERVKPVCARLAFATMLAAGGTMTARALLWLCLLSASVRAEPTDGGSDEIAEGKRHFVQGVALYNDGNYNAALAEFEAASRAHHEPVVRYNVGLCQKGLFRYAESITSLRAYLDEAKALPPQRKSEVEQMIAEMTALLVDLPLAVTPPEATVIVDGRALKSSGPLSLAAGHHVLELSADGYKPLRREVELFAGVPSAPLKLVLEAIPKTGRIRLTIAPATASVRLDGKPLLAREAELAVGGHTVEVSAPGHLPRTSEITIAGGQERELSVALDKQQLKPWTRWWFWTAAVAVVGGVVTAIAVPLSTTTQSPLPGSIDLRQVH